MSDPDARGAEMYKRALLQLPNGTLVERAGSAPAKLKLKFFRDILKPAPKLWGIKNVIAMGETSSWIAPPGKGKSTLLTDIAVHQAAKEWWRTYRVKLRYGTVYFALERGALVERRLKAYGLRDGLTDLPIAVVSQVIDLMSLSCVDLICDAIKEAEDDFGTKIGLSIFDTYSKGIAAGGGDENQAKDQNIVVANQRRVIDRTGIHIANIGHTGKDEKRGERGSNAHLADVDVQVQISGDLIKTATITKANDQPEGELTSFSLEPYDFEPDEDGDPFRTYIIGQEVVKGVAPIVSNMTPKQRLAMEALTEITRSKGQPAPPDYGLPLGYIVVATEDWKTELLRQNVIDPKGKNPHARFNDLRDGLRTKRIINCRDELVWSAAGAA